MRGKIFMLFGLLSCASFSQETIGKHRVELSGLFNIPLLSGNFMSDSYMKFGNSLLKTKDVFDYGASISYKKVTGKKKMAGVRVIYKRFGVQSNHQNQSLFLDDGIPWSNTYSSNVNMENFKINNFNLLGTYSFVGKNSFVDMGIMNELGLGYALAYSENKKYYYQLSDESTLENEFTELDFYRSERSIPLIHGVGLSYSIALQFPINEKVFVKIGSLSLLNIYFKPKYKNGLTDNSGVIDYEDLRNKVQRENFFTWNFEGALIYMF